MSPSSHHHKSSPHCVRTESPSLIDRPVFPSGSREGGLDNETAIEPIPPEATTLPVPKPKQRSPLRQVDADFWASLLGDQQMGQKSSNLKVLGLDPDPDYPEHGGSPNVKRSNNTTSKLVSNILLAEAKALQYESPLLRRPESVQAESRQHSGSSTDAQLMQVNDTTPSQLRRESSSHLALSSLQRDRGLAYALRRTDSNSTFQSLDGLNSAYPLIRKEAKKRKQQQRSRKQSGKSGQRRSRRSSTSRSVQSTRPKPSYAAQTLQCFVNPCLGVDDRVLSVRQEKGRRPRSDSSSHHHHHHHHHENKHATRNKLLELRSELSEMRRIASHNKEKFTMSTNASCTTSPRQRKVKFANPIVTLVNYRPYTEECDIPKLYFQEEELDELEWDREICPRDQFECFIDDKGLGISVDHCFAAHE